MQNIRQKITVVGFDFDGTLLDSMRTCYKGTCAVFAESHQVPPSFDSYLREFETPFVDYYRARGVRLSEREIWKVYEAGADHSLSKMFEDCFVILPLLKKLGYPLHIVTAQRGASVMALLKQVGLLNLFDNVVTDVVDKSWFIKFICKEVGISPQSMCYVGDFGSDVRHARKAGVQAIGITRGNNTTEVLTKAGADLCVDDLPQLFAFLEGQ